MKKFNFENYIITFASHLEALNFVGQMMKKNYDFYGLETIVEDMKHWDSFVYASEEKYFLLANRKYFKEEGYNEMTVEEALKLADTQNQNQKPPVIRWYKKGKLGKRC
jgi:hypothetical protein